MNETELIDRTINNYATYADLKEAEKQRALFTKDGKMTVYYPWNDPNTPEIVQGDDALMEAFNTLKQYQHTLHLIGQKSIDIVDESHAKAYVYTIAHHVTANDDGTRSLMIAYLRYQDSLVKENDSWLFEERILYADFFENRPLN